MRLAFALLLAVPGAALAQTPPVPAAPQVAQSLAWMHGTWQGPVRIFGREGEASLIAEPALRGKAMALAWKVAVPASEGKPAFEFEARGTYFVTPAGAVRGQWSDSQGHLHPLAGKVSGSAMSVTWGEVATEIGQSSYWIEPDGTLLISDAGLAKGAMQPFSEARLKRR